MRKTLNGQSNFTPKTTGKSIKRKKITRRKEIIKIQAVINERNNSKD